jgi:hypothetical protein
MKDTNTLSGLAPNETNGMPPIIMNILCFIVGASVTLALFHFGKLKLPVKETTTAKVETVSIQEYFNLETRCKYLTVKDQVKEAIIHDLIITKKVDTVFMKDLYYHMSDMAINPVKASKIPILSKEMKMDLTYQLDSLCADWLESIPYTMIDYELGRDTAWVQNSDTYKATEETILRLRRKIN